MASIEVGKNVWRVKFRDGGRDGDAVTFTVSVADGGADEALRLKNFIDANKNRVPPRLDLLRNGFGYLLKTVAVEEQRVHEGTTVVQYARQFVKGLTRPSDNSKAEYETYIRLYLEPFFGDHLMLNTERAHMREWQDWMTRRPDSEAAIEGLGLSVKTLKNIRSGVLNPMFRAAQLRGDHGEPPLMNYNPIDGLSLPKGKRKRRHLMGSPEEAAILIEAAYRIDPDAADLIVTDMALGARWGEIAGLPPQAIKQDRREIEISQVARRNRRTHKWELVEGPKTEAGYRTIPYGDAIAQLFERRLKMTTTQLPFTMVTGETTHLLFTNAKGSMWNYHNFHKRKWERILTLAKEMGMTTADLIVMYSLRKELLTLLAEKNVDPLTLTHVAGHEDLHTTLKFYGQSTGRGFDDVRNAVDSHYGEALAIAAAR